MKVRCLLINCYTLQLNYDNTCSNKWDHMFMSQYSRTSFEHTFQKQMLKVTYVFIQQHHFIDMKIGYLLIIYIKHENGLKEFQVKYGFLNVRFTCINLFRKFYMFSE
jgi:hypothetical protein